MDHASAARQGGEEHLGGHNIGDAANSPAAGTGSWHPSSPSVRHQDQLYAPSEHASSPVDQTQPLDQRYISPVDSSTHGEPAASQFGSPQLHHQQAVPPAAGYNPQQQYYDGNGQPIYHSGLEVAFPPEAPHTVNGQNLPEPVSNLEGQPQYSAAGQKEYPPGAYYQSYQQHNTPIPGKEDLPYEPSPPPPASIAEPKILGLKRKTFFIVAAILAVVAIAAIVGGAVGGTVGKRNSTTSADAADGSGAGAGAPASSTSASATATASSTSATASAGPTNPPSPLLATSRLSAINYTDGSGTNSYQMLFWQSAKGDLSYSLWDSVNKTWEIVNLATRLASGSTFVQPANGTPIAAVVNGWPYTVKPLSLNFGIAVFYLDANSAVQELISSDIRGTVWQVQNTGKLQAATGSDLAAWVGVCEQNCPQAIQLFYEDTSSSLRLFNQSNSDGTGGTTVLKTGIAQDSALTAAVIPGWDGAKGPVLSSPRCYTETPTNLQEVRWEDDERKYINSGVIDSKLPVSRLQVAATGFGNDATKNFQIYLVVTELIADGTVQMNWWNNVTWHTAGSPTLQNIPNTIDFSNFTSIAVSGDMTFWGLTSVGEVHTFAINRDDPTQWQYGAAVKTA